MDGEVFEGSLSEQTSRRLNWLRAGVMGANDGTVSTAAVVVGVAGAAVSNSVLPASGIAAVVAGALSMAVGEYVSVSSQRDSQVAELALERSQLKAGPSGELDQLTGLIRARGIDAGLVRSVAVQLTKKDPLTAHARLELGIAPGELVSPWHAGLSSMLTFVVGGLVPLLATLLSPRSVAVGVTVLAVVIALAATGSVSARLGGAGKLRAVARVGTGGLGAMAITYGTGLLAGTRI